MDLEQYKSKIIAIAHQVDKRHSGAKYGRKWDHYWEEKNHVVDFAASRNGGLDNVKTALDIGGGICMLAYILQQRGIEVECSDTEHHIHETSCSLINIPRFELWIYPQQPMNLPKHYDIIFSTRTVFDRAFQNSSDWEYFLNDVFKYTDRLFMKTNFTAPKDRVGPQWLRDAGYSFYSNKRVNGEQASKPIRAYYIDITKAQWENLKNSI